MKNQKTVIAVVETPQLGRPVNPNSAHQMKLKLRKQTKIAKPGRPVDPNSKRQQEILQRELLLVNGIEIKRGRPKMVKAVAVVNEPVQAA